MDLPGSRPIVYNDPEWKYLNILVPPLDINQIVKNFIWSVFSVNGSILKAESTTFQTFENKNHPNIQVLKKYFSILNVEDFFGIHLNLDKKFVPRK